MTDTHISPMFPLALIASGLSIAVFWALTYSFDGFAGAEVARHPLFAPGQMLHLVGAVFGTVGYFGLYEALRNRAGWLAAPASFIAIAGMILFAADAVIALIVFPALAKHAPDLLDPAGPIFTGHALIFYITCYATHMTGIIMLAGLMFFYNRISTVGLVAFLVGGIGMSLPPMQGLHWMAIAGGVVFGFGCTVLGITLLKKGA